MANANRTFRSSMMLSTALAALVAMPGAVHAQLVNSGDLVDSIDSGGNAGRLTVVDTSPTQTDMTVLSPVVVANWNRFNVPTGTTVNIAPDAALTQATLVNRVIGPNVSDISGSINAPDINLWLINQNGILFGNGAAVNSASFFASTLNASDQDLFDFYEGTDLAGNGSATINFGASLGNTITTTGPNVSFVSDGSLMFLSEQLNLDATFDAGTGTIAFVTASDLSVSFTPGSPLSYAVNAGTTVAQGQTIGGSVTGGAVDFLMVTAAGVVGALLKVDATVNANTAVPTDTGVRLFAVGSSSVTVEMDGGISSTGRIVAQATGNMSATAAIEGSEVFLESAGNLTLDDVTSTNGSMILQAGGSLSAGAVEAAGDLQFIANDTASFDSLVSTGGALSNSGAVPNSVTVTGLTQGESVDLAAFVLGLGDVVATAGGVSLAAIDSISANNVTANAPVTAAGSITIANGTSMSLGNLDASGAISLDTTGGINTGAITAGGALTVGSGFPPGSVTFTGDVSAASISVVSQSLFTSANLTATSGAITIDADGDINAGDLLAAGDITFFSNNAATAAFGSLVSTGGRILQDGDSPDTITVSGEVRGTSVRMAALNAVALGDVTSTAGDVFLVSFLSGISAGTVSATGGDTLLAASGDITTTSIDGTGDIEVSSFGGGALNLGEIVGGGEVGLYGVASLTTGAITTDGALIVGGGLANPGLGTPSIVNFNGNVSAASVTINATGSLNFFDITATAGNIGIDAASINGVVGGNLSATGGDVNLLASGAILTNSITAIRAGGVGGSVDVTSTGSGLALGDVTATGGDVDLAAPGTISALSITATQVGGVGGAIDVASSGGNTLDLGDLLSSGAIALDTLGAVNYATIDAGGTLDVGAAGAVASFSGGNVSAASVTVASLGDANMGSVTATAGSIDVSADEIIATAFSATGGDVSLLMNGGLIGAPAITATQVGGIGGAISVESTGGGLLSLGALDADGNIALDTSGDIIGFAAMTAGGALTIGSVAAPNSILLFEAVSAGSIAIDTLGDLLNLSGGLAATAGGVAVNAASITVGGAVSAIGGNVNLASAGGIFTSGISATEVAGIGGAIDVESSGGGDLTLGALTADGAVALGTAGSITTGAITAGGALDVGQVLAPADVTFTGNVSASSITIGVLGALDAAGLTATSGNIDVDALSIAAGNILAQTGNVSLAAVGDIATGTVSADPANTAGGTIGIISTGGGTLNLGELLSGGDLSLDTDGAIIGAGATSLGGAVLIGVNAGPLTADFNGAISGRSVQIDAVDAFSGQDVTATAGSVFIDAGFITTGAISATGGGASLFGFQDITTGTIDVSGGNVLLVTGEAISTGDITATIANGLGGAITVDSGGLSDVSLGNLTASANISLQGNGAIDTGAIDTGGVLFIGSFSFPGDVTIAGDAIASGMIVNNSGLFSSGALTTTNGVILLNSGAIDTGDLSAPNGNIFLLSVDDISTGNIGASGGSIFIDSQNGGAVSLGNVSGRDNILMSTTGAITAGNVTSAIGDVIVGFASQPDLGTTTTLGNVSGVNVTVQTFGALQTGTLTATAGQVVVTADTVNSLAITANGGMVDVLANGDVTTGAINAGTDVLINTSGNVATGAIGAGGDLVVGGTIVPAGVTFGGDATAASITIDATGALTAARLTALSGNVDIEADSILSSTVRATGGDVLLRSRLGTTTGTIIATEVAGAGGAVAVTATGGGALDLGAISASGAIDLNTSGSVSTLDIVSTGGVLTIGGAITPLLDIALGDVRATGVAVTGAAGFIADTLTATAGSVVVDAGSISTLGIRATGGAVDLLAVDDISTGVINATLAIDASSTGGGDLLLGSLQAGLGITLDTTGAVQTGAVSSSGGALLVGQTDTPGSVTFGGNVTAQAVNVLSAGEVLAGARDAQGALLSRTNITATSGGVDIDAGAITAGAISATGGNVTLLATGDVLTGNILAVRTGGVGGTIDVESTGGALDLGALSADLGIALDADGAVRVAGATARGGALTVGTASSPDSVTFTGNATGQSVTISTPGDVTGLALTATAGGVTVGANAITVGAVSATGNAALTALRGIQTGAIDADGTVTVTSTGTGANASNLQLGNVEGGQAVALSAGGGITAGVVRSLASSVTITAGTQIGTAAIIAGGGNATLSALNNITTGPITATGAISAVSTGMTGGDLQLGNLSAGLGITLDADGDIATGSVTATGGALLIGLASATDSVTIGGPVSARSVGVRSTGAVQGLNMTATAGDVTINAGTTIAAGALTATGGNVGLTAGGNIATGALTATRVGGAGGTVDVESTGGAINLGRLTADLGIDLDAAGAIAVTGGMTARNGSITADGRSISVDGAGTATGGDIILTALGSIITDALTATRVAGVGGAIDIESTGTGANAGMLGLGALLADRGIELDARGSISALSLTARSGAVDVDGASITVSDGTSATGGNVRLLATGAITTGPINAARAGGVGGAIDIDSTNGGAINLGPAVATHGITVDTLGTVTAAGLDAGTASNVAVGVDRLASAVTFTGPARAANITVRTSGLFSADLMTANNGEIRVSARDVELRRAVTAGTVALTSTVAAPNANTPQVGLGTATGVMSLTDAELDRINANRLVIDAGAGEVRIAGVSFTDDAGRSNVDIATTGLIRITGDLSGTGSARTFRLGGNAAGAGTASRITANIDTATIDFGTSTLALRGSDIVFGQQALITMVAGMTLDQQVKELIGNAGSLLYTPEGLSAARLANPTYLTAGRMVVTYGGSALFQNSAPRSSGTAFEGVKLGGAGAPAGPALDLNPLITPNVVDFNVQQGNVFALFGSINGATGPAASLGGSSVIRLNGNVLVPASRVNGCIIGSAEGCITTIVGNFILSVPRELISPIVAEEGVPLPFDPLVGTNNESLFSDAASAPGSDENCRERNAAGQCVEN